MPSVRPAAATLNFPCLTSASTISRFRSLPLINNLTMYGRCSTPTTPHWGHFKRVHMGTLLKSRDIILFSLLALCFGGLCTGFYFDWYIYTHSPRQPDVSLGYIYPAVVHHGAKFYLSAEQWRWSES